MVPLLPVLLLAMVVGLEVRGWPDGLRSDESPSDLLIPLLVKSISKIFNRCYHQISSEGARSVESFGETIAGSWSSPCSSLSVEGHPVAVQDQFIGVLLVCNGMESTVLLQVWNLHMLVGVVAPGPHFSDRLSHILSEVLRCFDDIDVNEIKAMMGVSGRCCVATMVVVANSGNMVSMKIFEFTYGNAIATKEQDFQRLCCIMLFLSAGDHAEEAVLLLFGFFHQRWTTSLLLIPRFNSGDLLRLSSVLVHIYLQLKSPLPQVHMPDRPLGEPPAGHQLVWSAKALGD